MTDGFYTKLNNDKIKCKFYTNLKGEKKMMEVMLHSIETTFTGYSSI